MAYDFSVQLYAVRTELEKDPLQTLHKLKKMGFSGVEGFGHFVYSSQDINKYLSETGLKIAGYHTPWDLVQDDKLKSTINYFTEIRNKFVIIPGLPDECTNSIDAWKRTADRFNVISKKLNAEGFYLGYHNHHQEFQMIEGQIPFTVFFDNTDPSIVIQIDNGNALYGGADLMAVLQKYPGRARSVHLKPYSKENGFAPVIGKDDINWKDFLHWCRDKGGTEQFIVEYEDEKTHPQMEGVDLCIKALREMEATGKI